MAEVMVDAIHVAQSDEHKVHVTKAAHEALTLAGWLSPKSVTAIIKHQDTTAAAQARGKAAA